jgi:hypothetical protein
MKLTVNLTIFSDYTAVLGGQYIFPAMHQMSTDFA